MRNKGASLEVRQAARLVDRFGQLLFGFTRAGDGDDESPGDGVEAGAPEPITPGKRRRPKTPPAGKVAKRRKPDPSIFDGNA